MGEEATAALVHRAIAGDAGAYEALVRRHLRAAYAVALAVVRTPAEAEDVAQEALVVAWEKLESCEKPVAFGAWLINIARNRARNVLARRRVRNDFVDREMHGDETAAPPSAQVQARAELLMALGALDERQREVVLLHDLEGLSHAEVAQALSLSEVNSRQLLFTARKAMRQRLATQDVQEESPHG